jgi:hypothetical protein
MYRSVQTISSKACHDEVMKNERNDLLAATATKLRVINFSASMRDSNGTLTNHSFVSHRFTEVETGFFPKSMQELVVELNLIGSFLDEMPCHSHCHKPDVQGGYQAA